MNKAIIAQIKVKSQSERNGAPQVITMYDDRTYKFDNYDDGEYDHWKVKKNKLMYWHNSANKWLYFNDTDLGKKIEKEFWMIIAIEKIVLSDIKGNFNE